MARVNDTKVRIVLLDDISKPLSRINSAMNGFTRNIKGAGNGANSFRNINNDLSGIEKRMENLNENSRNFYSTLTKISGAYKAIGTIVNAFTGITSGVFDYAKSFQTNAVGISGILSSIVKMDGKTLQWNDSMRMSKDIMTKLRIEALQTAATSEDLIETFRALLGPGLSSGMSIDQVLKFTSVGVNAVKSLGLPTNQLIQELRDLVQGGIRASSSTLATALGLTDADIKAAKASSEGLFKFLMDRMAGFKQSTSETANTIHGKMEILKEAMLSAGEQSTRGWVNAFSGILDSINQIVLKKNEFTGMQEVNPELVNYSSKLADIIGEKFNNIGKNIKMAYDNWEQLSYALAAFVFPTVFEKSVSALKNIHTIATEISTAFSGVEHAAISAAYATNMYAEANAKMASNISTYESLKNVINTSANNIDGLAKKWERMGMAANQAAEAQKKVVTEVNSGNLIGAAKIIEQNNKLAEQEKIKESIKKKALDILSITKKQVAEEERRVSKALEAENLIKQNAAESKNIVSIYKQLNSLGASRLEMHKQVIFYLEAINKGNKVLASTFLKNLEAKTNELTLERQELLNAEKKISLNNALADQELRRVEVIALANAARVGDDKYVNNINRIIQAEQKHIEELRAKKAPQEQINALILEYSEFLLKAAQAQEILSEEELKDIAVNQKHVTSIQGVVTHLNSALGKIGAVTSGLSSLAFAAMIVSDEEDKTTRELAQSVIVMDLVVNSLSTMCGKLKEAIIWWNGLKVAVQATYITAGLAIATLASVGYAAYSKYQDSKDETMEARYDELGNVWYEKKKVAENNPADVPDYLKGVAEKYKNSNFVYNENANLQEMKYRDMQNGTWGNIELQHEKIGDTKKSKGKTAEEKAQELKDKYNELVASIKSSTAALDENGDAYLKNMAKADKDIASWTKKLNAMKADEEKVKEAQYLMALYRSEMEKKATEAKRQQLLSLNKLEEEQARLTMELGVRNQNWQHTLINSELQARKQMIEEILTDERLAYEQRVRYEKELAATKKSIRENDMYDMKTAWKATLEEISLQQVNFGESIKSVFSTVQSAGAELLSSTASFSEKVANFFNSITQSILENMAKMIMQGLITNAILSAFGGGGTTIGIGSTNLTSSFPSTSSLLSMPAGIGVKAKGGYASGWNIVGEQGPELVNFSNPARVYTAQQTANALSGAAGNVNIKIDLKNESGQQMQAETTGTSFDGESYIVGVVLKAISTNKNGIRTVLRGV